MTKLIYFNNDDQSANMMIKIEMLKFKIQYVKHDKSRKEQSEMNNLHKNSFVFL